MASKLLAFLMSVGESMYLKFLLLLSIIISSCSQVQKNTNVISEENKAYYAMGFLIGKNYEKLNLSIQRLKLVEDGLKDAATFQVSKVDLEIYTANVEHLLKNKIPNEDEKTYYALGFILGVNLQKLQLTQSQLNSVTIGLSDSSQGHSSVVDLDIYSKRVPGTISNSITIQKEEGLKFIEQYLLSNKNAKQTSTGLVYEVLREGFGKSPSSSDVVEVHYHGTLINGEVFDSSFERGKTIQFPLNRVIRGWTEGLQLMKEGSKVRFIIPSDLAYGDEGSAPQIKGGSTLVFDVELFKVNP